MSATYPSRNMSNLRKSFISQPLLSGITTTADSARRITRSAGNDSPLGYPKDLTQAVMMSTGSGNTMVLFFSAPTSVNVWR